MTSSRSLSWHIAGKGSCCCSAQPHRAMMPVHQLPHASSTALWPVGCRVFPQQQAPYRTRHRGIRTQCTRQDCAGTAQASQGDMLSASTLSKRSVVLQGLMLAAALPALNAHAESLAGTSSTDISVLQAYWQDMMDVLVPLLGDDFKAKLLLYSPRAILPTGAVGDPATDYSSKRKGQCGTFQPGSDRPYAVCGDPGAEPVDSLSRSCCRHFAYACGQARFGFAAVDRSHTVVISPRVQLLQERSWKAMLTHEMGHCIDFHAYGGRYGMPQHQVQDPLTAETLAGIASAERDPELRADNMANALLAPLLGGKQLCYDPSTTLQVLVPASVACSGTGEAGDPAPMAHYTHPPLSGRYS